MEKHKIFKEIKIFYQTLGMYLSGKFYAKKTLVWKYLKMLKLPLTCFPCSERTSVNGLVLDNWHGQIYPGQQNGKEITL